MSIDLHLSADEAAVHELFTEFFARECPSTVVRQAEALGFAPALWDRYAQTGGPALAVSERAGGSGAGLLAAVLAAEAAGAVLAPLPVVEHLVALRLLDRVGRPDLAAGMNGVCTVALHRAVGGRWRLVPFGAAAAAVLGLDEDRLVLGHGPAPGTPAPNGSGLAVADRSLAGAEVLCVGAPAVAAHERAVDEWRLLTAACLVGLAGAALDQGVTYVSTRHQFGVPIGSYQALQHGLAEFCGPLAGARLLVRRAAWRFDRGSAEPLAVDAPIALHFTTELARSLTARVLHYHGGYGAMAETDIQLHYRRARGWPAQLGDPDDELDLLADRLYGSVA